MKFFKKHSSHILKALIFFCVIALVIWINSLPLSESFLLEYIEAFGYWGLFVISAISGFNILVPIPVSSFFPIFLSAGFHPAGTIAIISLGMLGGDIIGYVLGRTGRSMIGEKKKEYTFLRIIENLEKKHPILPYVFLSLYAAFFPLPNELVVIPMGFLKFRATIMFSALFIGNTIFNIIIASAFVGLTGIF